MSKRVSSGAALSGKGVSRKWGKWTPAAVAVVVVAGVAIAVPVAANASVSLPTKTPAQVLELLESSRVQAFSGEITETSDLGLPSLPTGATAEGSGSDSSLASDLALLTGSNSLRVYVDGPKNLRLQDLGSLSERDVIRDGKDLWTYDSQSNSVEHATLTVNPNQHFSRPGVVPSTPGQPSIAEPRISQPSIPQTPDGLAKELVAKLESTSTLSVDDNLRVAGRAAYDLVLTPNATDTLVGSVAIAVDADTGMPLQVQVMAAGQKDPAVSIGFTSLDLSKPDASLFDFTPPAGAKVKELKSPLTRPVGPTHAPNAKPNTQSTEKVTGHGWDAVVTIAATSSEAGQLGKLSTSPEFAELTTPVAGGRVLHTSLFNILFSSDGRIIAGAVSVDRLQAVAAQ
jgi:outer membrane lipoprotein-sorting protein